MRTCRLRGNSLHRHMRDSGIADIAIRHAMRDLTETALQRFGPNEMHLAHSLAIGSRTARAGLHANHPRHDLRFPWWVGW